MGRAGGELVALAAAFALAISENLSADEIDLLSDFFNALGDNLALIAAGHARADSGTEQR